MLSSYFRNDLIKIEGDTYDLGVTRVSFANNSAGWIHYLPATVTDSTPEICSNTASRHQKQPPPSVASSFAMTYPLKRYVNQTCYSGKSSR